MFGAICGDILGSQYEFEEIKYERPEEIRLCRQGDRFTDDSALTMAVAHWLLEDLPQHSGDEALKEALAARFLTYSLHTFEGAPSSLGFGGRYFQWCARAELIGEFAPYQSFGNGAGMRVSPVGWFFDTMEQTLRFALLSADVTHDHPEGEKGAMCVAAAVFMARQGKSKAEIRSYLRQKFGYELLDKSVAQLRAECRWSEICRDTVPMAVVAFLESEDFESALRNAISYGSDSDTIGAMTGAIAEAYYGIPDHIAAHCRQILPPAQRQLVDDFYAKITNQ